MKRHWTAGSTVTAALKKSNVDWIDGPEFDVASIFTGVQLKIVVPGGPLWQRAVPCAVEGAGGAIGAAPVSQRSQRISKEKEERASEEDKIDRDLAKVSLFRCRKCRLMDSSGKILHFGHICRGRAAHERHVSSCTGPSSQPRSSTVVEKFVAHATREDICNLGTYYRPAAAPDGFI